MILDKLAKLGSREKIGLTIAGVVLLLLVLDALVARPVAEKLKALELEIDETSAELVYNLRVLKWSDRIRAEYVEVSGLLGAPVEPALAMDRLTAEVDTLAQQAGVEVPSMANAAPRESEHLVEYVVDVGEFEAGIDEIVRLLHTIAERPGLLRVPRFVLTPDPDSAVFNGSMLVTRLMVAGPES